MSNQLLEKNDKSETMETQVYANETATPKDQNQKNTTT